MVCAFCLLSARSIALIIPKVEGSFILGSRTFRLEGPFSLDPRFLSTCFLDGEFSMCAGVG